MEQAPVQIGQFILGKNLGIGAFGKVRNIVHRLQSRHLPPPVP
jgi:5'-AMP-activated protein kinase catalytic alpha subunit